MRWEARWPHVSQLYAHPGDPAGTVEGASDCFEASLARYLRETGYPFNGDDHALVGWLRQEVTGQPDHADQPGTLLTQGTAGLAKLHILAPWTSDLATARQAAFAIYWVRGTRLRLLQPVTVDGAPWWTAYPLNWFEDDGLNHFILKLPDGSFDDPLAYWCTDCRYSDTSLAGAFGGAWCLAAPAWSGSSSPAGSEQPGTPLQVLASGGLHLREVPSLQAPILATLDAGEQVRDVYAQDCLWSFVEARGLHGWVRREFVKEVSQ